MEPNEIKEETVDLKHGQEVKEEYAQISSLTGDYVNLLKNREFTILGYKTIVLKDRKNEKNLVKKLILRIKLAENGLEMDYFPNKTSINSIISERGLAYKDWVGYSTELISAVQMINGAQKRVIYVV